MFTGLIESVGEIKSISLENKSAILGITPKIADFASKIGDSVAINGVCLTIEKIDGKTLFFRAVRETLSKTNLGKLKAGEKVNLERALLANGRFDGHIVLGHVDTVAKIEKIESDGSAFLFWISADSAVAKYIAPKGSVCIDGISLTVAEVEGSKFKLSIIPHTLKNTTLENKKAGDLVNLECDVLARYIERMLNVGANHNLPKNANTYRAKDVSPLQKNDGNLLELLERGGF